MSISTAPVPVSVKKRRTYRRLLLLTAFLLFGSIAGWMIWGALRDWADAKALQQYFTELEAREPGWQDRVYGKPLTQAQLDDHQRWAELQQLLPTTNPAWAPYRQGLYSGMYQDSAQPEAMLPVEQAEFLKVAHQFWQPILQKLATLKTLPGRHRFLDRNSTYEQMLAQFGAASYGDSYLVNEAVEVEVLYHIMMNDPEQAARWFSRCKSPTAGIGFFSPFLVERWLNLTQPSAAALFQLQQILEQHVTRIEGLNSQEFRAELRLMEKLIRELSQGDLTIAQINRTGLPDTLVRRDSVWHSFALGWAYYPYVKFRIAGMFQRPDHLILRLHQLADQIEALPRLEPAIRWSTWKNYAEAQKILIERKEAYKRITQSTYSDAIPEGLYLLRGNYVHIQVLVAFETLAQVNTTLAAVIAERFRIDQGRFPTNWEELVPKYIAQPILDPFTGKPLLMKLNDKGIVVYSVGGQGKDEGGENLSSNHYWHYGGKGWDVKNTNLGTRIYLPALRRGPAIQLETAEIESLKEQTQEALKLMKKAKEEKK